MADGWAEGRRLSSEFLETILTEKAFVDATPYGGVRILGALIDKAPLNLEHVRLRHVFWLEKSRILVRVECRNLQTNSELSFEGCFMSEDISLNVAHIGASLSLGEATIEGEVDLVAAKIGSTLVMSGSTFEGPVKLDSAMVSGSAFLDNGASFKRDLGLTGAKIGSDLGISGSTFAGAVDLTSARITGNFLLGFDERSAPCWEDSAMLTLRNTHVGALQDWWLDDSANAWPKLYHLEGFTYERLGKYSSGRELNMTDRSASSYIEWLRGDPGSSPQPYEHLANRFKGTGEPNKAADILYAARERRRHAAWSREDHYGQTKTREIRRALGLSALHLTIGYGLGNRYFRVLWWVGGLTIVGTFVLICFGSHSLKESPLIFFASLDQLLPIITFDKAHDALIFGDSSAKPPIVAQPYGVRVYFFAHKAIGWILGFFLAAGLGGLTQRN